MRQGSIVDTATMLLAQLGVSMPVYWLGLLLMLLFAVKLGWLPAIGRGVPLLEAPSARRSPASPQVLADSLAHILLPALALAANSAAIISRLVRTSMLEVLREDFVRTAYAKGLRRPRVVIRHALRNALLPVLSVIGLRFGALLGGAVLAESDLRLAGPRAADHRRHLAARPAADPGHRADLRADLRAGEPRRRPALRRGRSAHPAGVSAMQPPQASAQSLAGRRRA